MMIRNYLATCENHEQCTVVFHSLDHGVCPFCSLEDSLKEAKDALEDSKESREELERRLDVLRDQNEDTAAELRQAERKIEELVTQIDS